jgi:hypothetical protein
MEVKKIVTKADSEKKRRRNQIIIGGILIFVMFFSVLGYTFGDNSNGNAKKIVYNGYEFVYENGFWKASIGNFVFFFTYNPEEVWKSDANLNLLNKYSGKPLYISSDSIDAESELYRNIDQIILRRQYACLQGENCTDSGLPVKTCEDNFIIIKESNVSSIRQDNNCVFIESPFENLTATTDEFLFKIIGIE